MNAMSNNKIAMWSGPRNISTALMYSFDNRTDTICIDEPLYSYYLSNTNIIHPGRKEVIDNCEGDINCIIDTICGEIPDNMPIYYQKHMAHHVLPETPIDWIFGLKNCFLIRNPKDVILSLSQKIGRVEVESTGLIQQNRLFDQIIKSKSDNPIIIDSSDILRKPEYMLIKLCKELEIPFESSMLSWPAGKRDCDGIWARYWYDEVWKSTEFKHYKNNDAQLSDSHLEVYNKCKILYDRLHALRIR
jgi:hypothetical protein